MRVVVTRPKAQATAWVERLHALGVDAVALPLLISPYCWSVRPFWRAKCVWVWMQYSQSFMIETVR